MLFLSIDVNADTSYDMTNRITSPVNYSECGVGSYTGVELNGATNCWNTKTRYQGTLNRIYFNLPAPSGSFEGDTAYRLTIKMATDDWRNNFGTVVVSPGSSYTNNFVDTFTFVSQKQVNITFTVPYSGSTTYQYLWVNLPAKSSGYLITGVSNWNLSNVTLTKLTSGSGGGSSTPSGPSTSFDDTAIINSGKENTQDIINNNNTNTQDVINNANENTQVIKDSIKDNLNNCRDSHNLFNINGEVNVRGNNGVIEPGVNVVSNNVLTTGRNGDIDHAIGQQITGLSGKTITFSAKVISLGTGTQGALGIYDNYELVKMILTDTPNTFISTTYTPNSDNVIFGFFTTGGSGAKFTDIQVNEGSSRLSYEPFGQVCTNKIDDTTNAIKEQTEVSRSIFGKIGDIFTSIINLPIKIAEKLLDMLKSLFIPDSEEFEDLINDFKDTISLKLGVIYQAGDLIINIFTSIINDDSPENACLTFPKVTLPNDLTIIEQTQFCFNSVTDNVPILLTLIRSLSGIFITITFINMLKKKYDDFINGGHL